jgi:hypothetical protein
MIMTKFSSCVTIGLFLDFIAQYSVFIVLRSAFFVHRSPFSVSHSSKFDIRDSLFFPGSAQKLLF